MHTVRYYDEGKQGIGFSASALQCNDEGVTGQTQDVSEVAREGLGVDIDYRDAAYIKYFSIFFSIFPLLNPIIIPRSPRSNSIPLGLDNLWLMKKVTGKFFFAFPYI